MTDSDPSGFEAAIAEIPANQMSTRGQLIAAGVAQIKGGASIYSASKATGIPYTTLQRHAAGITTTDHEKGFRAGEQALVAAHLAIASVAAEKVFEKVDANTLSEAGLLKAMGISTDKVAVYRSWGRGMGAADDKTQDALAGALQGLRDGKRVQITEPDKAAEAIEVTATVSNSDE